MFVNPDKFQSIVIYKKKRDHTKETFETGDKVIEAVKSHFAIIVTPCDT